MEFIEIPEYKIFKCNSEFIVKIKQSVSYNKKEILYEDLNVKLNKLLTINSRLLGYSLEYNNMPRILTRPISAFVFYSPVEDIEVDKELEVIYNDKIVRLLKTKSYNDDNLHDYAFLIRLKLSSISDDIYEQYTGV